MRDRPSDGWKFIRAERHGHGFLRVTCRAVTTLQPRSMTRATHVSPSRTLGRSTMRPALARSRMSMNQSMRFESPPRHNGLPMR